MKILPSRFLPVVNKYVNSVRAFLGRRVSNRRRSTTAIGTVYSSVDNFARFPRHFFVPLLHSFVVTISNNQSARYHFLSITEQRTEYCKNQTVSNLESRYADKLERYQKWRLDSRSFTSKNLVRLLLNFNKFYGTLRCATTLYVLTR